MEDDHIIFFQGGDLMTKYSFTLKETDGAEVSLKDYLGRKVIVYFYPKDNTSG